MDLFTTPLRNEFPLKWAKEIIDQVIPAVEYQNQVMRVFHLDFKFSNLGFHFNHNQPYIMADDNYKKGPSSKEDGALLIYILDYGLSSVVGTRMVDVFTNDRIETGNKLHINPIGVFYTENYSIGMIILKAHFGMYPENLVTLTFKEG